MLSNLTGWHHTGAGGNKTFTAWREGKLVTAQGGDAFKLSLGGKKKKKTEILARKEKGSEEGEPNNKKRVK